MTFVVSENCRRCRFTDCVAVCPADCFHGDEEMLYINPDTCIDCGACVPECPVEAIFDEGSLPEEQSAWLEINAERSKRLPIINQKAAPLASAARVARERGFLLLD